MTQLPRPQEVMDRSVQKANKGGSLKLNLPPEVITKMDLKPGDTVRFSAHQDGKHFYAEIRKLKITITEL